jgi:hypothetical protein
MSEDFEESYEVSSIPMIHTSVSGLPPAEQIPPDSFPLLRVKGQISDKLSGRERVAVWFAWVLLGLISLICTTLLWEHHHIQLPQSASGSDQKTAIENYKALTALIDERTERFFDLFVTKALLPVFTTLIGFLLGRRSRED